MKKFVDSRTTRPVVPVTNRVAVNHSAIRESNLALVAGVLFSDGSGLTRADLAQRTGLTRATISRLVKDLISLDMVVEGPASDSQGAGRPGTPLFPASRTMVGIGLEVNADKVSGVAIDLTGATVDSFAIEIDLVGSDPEPVMALLHSHTEALVERLEGAGIRDIVGVYVGVPGIVDAATNRVVFAPNLGWRDLFPAAYLQDIFGPDTLIHVDNDANLQGVAAASHQDQTERWPSSFIYLTGDVGIGGCIVTDNISMAGLHGWAGEVGHLTIEPDGPACHCGSAGCLERYAGRQAILANAGLPTTATTSDLVKRIESNDPQVIEAIRVAGWALGIAISNVVNLIDMTHVVLGTSLGAVLPWMRPVIERELDRRIVGRTSNDIRLLAAPVEAYPTAKGGALKALQTVLEMHA
ncbi:ROK family transcriptional regulator [Changpingibacter yushuensis]|uniref:ROK family transcriptional regulator n=1 Tax=Changpingibacter yushuensis TaxID=2758440 RepID=UPI0015F65805|nr:ROK family transcriptional regulator [Changpingibacter yushuensis]